MLTIHARLAERESVARTERDVLQAIDYALAWMWERNPHKAPGGIHTPTFWEYFEDWGRRESTSKRQRALCVRVVARLMGRRENWNGIDSAYFFRLMQRMEAEGYSMNYRWNIGSRLRAVMHEGYRLKYHGNDDFREFKCPRESIEAIALTNEEIGLLWDYSPDGPLHARVRDLALIGYYSAARFSDYSRLSLANIRDGVLEFYQRKTGEKVSIPASPRLVAVLKRNGGKAPSVCQVVFNREIKKVAKGAGIDGIVPLSKAQAKADGTPTYRWEMCQSHTFRRSALTNLYRSGVSIKDCMYVSGHRSLSAFQAYLRIGAQESMDRLMGVNFFK